MTYLNVWTSITAYINQQKDMIVANGIVPVSDIEMIDWEEHANIEELPAVNLIGPASLAIEEQSSQIYHVAFTVGLGSFKDEGLSVHRRIIDFLGGALTTGTRISVYDTQTQQPYSWLKILDGTTTAPVSRSGLRPLQFIQAEGLVDPMA